MLDWILILNVIMGVAIVYISLFLVGCFFGILIEAKKREWL